ncbi:MAG: heat-inducible transcriptional repressor HrcA [Chloroflexota bacterium]
MDELTERQKLILALVIRYYIEYALPVGSNLLVEQFGLDISSATVRNEMASLAETGYLTQPHTSAGRVPTEEGYRYFVRQLMVHTDLPDQTKRMITHQFYQARHDVDQWMRLAASVLAHYSKAASLVTAPHPEEARLKHLELISTREYQVLMVLVLVGGDVRQQFLALAEPLPQERLSAVAERINSLCRGLGVADILRVEAQLAPLEKDILRIIYAEMERSDSMLAGEIYHDGLTNVLAEPEFAESESARRAFRVLEERALLHDLLSRTVMTTDVGGVQVLIGGDDTWDDLRECSMVLARYGSPGLATGTLGVLGPIRMAYARSISTVRFVADLMSNLVLGTLAE